MEQTQERKLKVYATRKNEVTGNDELFVGIMGMYHMTPRWYRTYVSPTGMTYIRWRERRYYLADLEFMPEVKLNEKQEV